MKQYYGFSQLNSFIKMLSNDKLVRTL